MVWKQRFLKTFTDLKNEKHLYRLIAGLILLFIVIPYVALINHSNNRKINAIFQDLESLKNGMSTKKLESALKNENKWVNLNIHGAHSTERRKKRDVGKRQEPEDGSKSPIHGQGGAMYIRWGRTTCPDNYTELVYNGIAGGSWHDHHGSATNLQCLPNKPDWGRFTGSAGNAFMYGIEYRDSMDGILDMSNVQSSLVNHNVPCAVCRSSLRASSLMVPAKNVCFEGWHLEYHGYLMAGHHGSKSGTQYICVDESPKADPAGYRDEGGALLFRVTVQCGSLPCPRYVQNRELTCVVCTK